VAQGRLEAAFASDNSHDWDLAAAGLVVQEAGGVLTTFDGEPLTFNRREPRHRPLLVAGRERHRRLLASARELRPS
jgi:myo-inositol-1(or 4)-monophosphatase